MVERPKEPSKKRATRRTDVAPSRTPYQKIGGALLAIAGMVILMGIITAEALMPAAANYSTSASDISHWAVRTRPTASSCNPPRLSSTPP